MEYRSNQTEKRYPVLEIFVFKEKEQTTRRSRSMRVFVCVCVCIEMLATRYQQLVDIVIYVIRERRQSFTYGKIIQNIRRTLARTRRERIDPASDETSRQMESRKFRSKFRLFRNSTK